MALILLAGAGYSYYASQKNQQPAYPLDPDLSLEGKESIDFLPLELKSSLFTNSFTTITFYNGDYRNVSGVIENRVQEILKANPWLGGWIAQKPDDSTVRLWYDPNSIDTAPNIFTVNEPGEIPLKRDTKYVQYEEICSLYNVRVPVTSKLIGKNQSVYKVSIVPDAVDHYNKFALIVSTSHLIGDNYTYYKLFHMLNPSTKVEKLNPIRVENYKQNVEKLMGAEEAYYFEKSNPDFVDQILSNYKKDQQEKESLLFTVSQEWLDYQMKQCIMDAERDQDAVESSSSLPPVRPAEVILSW
jgi:hypothetical protein